MLRRPTLVLLAVLALGPGLLGACSSDDDTAATTTTAPSTCEALQGLSAAVSGLGQVDILAEGTNALRDQLDAVQAAFDEVQSTAGDQFGDQVSAVDTALGQVANTMTQAGDSGQTLGDVAGQLRTDLDQLRTAWQDLADAADTELGGCDLSTTAATTN